MAKPPIPVEAATVILTRPATDGWECYMVRRHVKSDFASDVYVFPGGKVDEADRVLARTLADSPWPPDDTARRIAAIRELFEEAGVLLAGREGEAVIHPDGDAADRFSGYREKLHGGSLSLASMVQGERLQLRLERLHVISHWITPESFPRRFDTWFYVTDAPEGQEPLHDALETTEGTWIAPTEALRRYRDGRFPLVFATEKHLERLARYSSASDLIASVQPLDLEAVMPRVVERDGQTHFLIPGESGYET